MSAQPVDVLTHSAEHWDEQARFAVDYAMARPASDLKGFCAALRDSAEFQRLAALARCGVTP